MQSRKWLLVLSTLPLAALLGCNPVAGDSAAPLLMTLQFGEDTTDAEIGFFSDVADDSGNPGPDDSFIVTARATQKSPTLAVDSELTRIFFEAYSFYYTRQDGRNEPGVDVPFPRTLPIGGSVENDGTAELNLIFVTREAKVEPPLRNLYFGNQRIYCTLTATVYGRDATNNEVAASASTVVVFGDFSG